MATRRPLVVVSGVTSELPPGDVVTGAQAGTLVAGSGLIGGGALGAGTVTVDIALAAAPSGLIFVGDALGIDGSALASANTALASGNAALSSAATALSSGNAALSSASAKLPLAGGTMTGAVVGFSGGTSQPGVAVGSTTYGLFSSPNLIGLAANGSGVIYANNTNRLGFNVPSPSSNFDYSGGIATNIVALGAGSGIDCSLGNYFTCTVNGSTSFSFNNVPSTRSFAFTQEVTHTTGTITWPSSVAWPKNTPPTLTTGKTHLFIFVTDDGGSRWRGASLVDYTN